MLVVAALAAGQRGAQALQPEEGHLISHFPITPQVSLGIFVLHEYIIRNNLFQQPPESRVLTLYLA